MHDIIAVAQNDLRQARAKLALRQTLGGDTSIAQAEVDFAQARMHVAERLAFARLNLEVRYASVSDADLTRAVAQAERRWRAHLGNRAHTLPVSDAYRQAEDAYYYLAGMLAARTLIA